MAINTSRVLVGGLAAGIVANVVSAVGFGVLLSKRVAAEMIATAPTLQGRGTSTGTLAANVVISFVVGILLVWVYAAMRPRFGPGPRTAAYAALVVWICGFVYHLDWVFVGLMTATTFALAMATALVQVLAAATVGAMLYREDTA